MVPKYLPKSPDFPPPDSAQSEKRSPNSKSDFDTMVEFYLANHPYVYGPNGVSELEVRFGTNPKNMQPISKIDYDNVVQQFKSAGFTTPDNNGINILRIRNEYMHPTKHRPVISNIRAEIVGVDLVKKYCESNDLQKVLHLSSSMSAAREKIKFTQKMAPMVGPKDAQKPLRPVDFPDFNFRLSYQYEKDYSAQSNKSKEIIQHWADQKKDFRYINRLRWSHPDYPVFLDVSVVKSSPRFKNVPITHYTVQQANLFQNTETYEIELEIDNKRVGPGTPFDKPGPLAEAIRKCIRIVLSGLQGTNYPISLQEKNKVLLSYLDVIYGSEYAISMGDKLFGDDWKERNRAKNKLGRHFIGPSSYTLQLKNIQPVDDKTPHNQVPNIRNQYTVTDKADGERKLLYIAGNGRIYMIDINMNVIFTGTMTRNQDAFNSILDGEHIKYDKKGAFLNQYAAFDLYFAKGESKRELAFAKTDASEEDNKYRLSLLQQFIQNLASISILDADAGNSNPKAAADTKGKHACPISIVCKHFWVDIEGNIFQHCASILSQVHDGTYPYNTDGLIFTPANTGVGSDKVGSSAPLDRKCTWNASFKWKPAEYNTIDFLVSTKKDKTGKDEIHHIFQEGTNLASSQNIITYKVLELKCGFNKKEHMYLNPLLSMINNTLPTPGDINNEMNYEPINFQPTNPFDPKAYLCNMVLQNSGTNGMALITEEGEYFEQDMIVEFRYDVSKEDGWRWIPLRVRYDKTNDLRNGGRNYGNAYHVANNNWHSIHNPITETMITKGEGISSVVEDTNIYYNRSSKTNTKPLRDFHNLFVKRHLILGTCNRDNLLIDFAMGKGGDLPKWIAARLAFVFGIDISTDNIENTLDGACARYLNARKDSGKIPEALFVQGNSVLNIRSGKAFTGEKYKQISRAVFGQGAKDKTELGEGVYKQYGVGEEGFHVSSCQFALHYFFENETTMHSFLRNVSECTRLNGYFIGTCYDGQTVFNALRKINPDDSFTVMRDGEKLCEITKKYDKTGFPEDELSLGYAIDVFQESINTVQREYLVHFPYLIRVLENYGFQLVTTEEAVGLGLPNGSGMFEELYNAMVAEVARDKRSASNYGQAAMMTSEEKKISFWNRYFVFRKVRNVNEEKVMKIMMKNLAEVEEDQELEKTVDTKPVIRKIRGVKRKIVIQPATVPTTEEGEPEGKDEIKYISKTTISIPKKK